MTCARMLVVLLAACSAPATRSPLTSAPSASSRRALDGYPAPVEPADVGCTLGGYWDPAQPRALQFRADGPSFATALRVKRAELTLADTGAFVELASEGVRVWGFVPRDELILRAARPFVIADYVVPGPSAVLRWAGTNARAISIELMLPSYVQTRVAARADRACRDLSLGAPAGAGVFDPRDALGDAIEDSLMLADEQTIQVSTSPGGPPIAELRFGKHETPLVDVIERRDQHARIVVHTPTMDPADDSLIFGWVPSAVLRPHSHGFGGSWGTGTERSAGNRHRRGSRQVTCPHEVPLVAEVAGEQHLVGAVALGAVIEIVDGPGALLEIGVPAAQLELADGARLLARRTALADCAARQGFGTSL